MTYNSGHIIEQLALGEDSHWEFKQVVFEENSPKSPSRNDWADEMAAFANTNGGVILCGVTDGREVNPYALELLMSRGHDTENLCSKSWEEFEETRAPVMDFVLTVCDSAVSEVCPIWPGGPVMADWGLADPATAGETETERRKAFETTYELLKKGNYPFN